MALSVACAFSACPRPLAGMSPWEDRTFLPTLTCRIQRLPGRAGTLSIRKIGRVLYSFAAAARVAMAEETKIPPFMTAWMAGPSSLAAADFRI